MAINNFKPFAVGSGANVLSQSDYEALAALLTGFVSGTAQSAQLNKVWRQSSIMSAVLAQFIADNSGQDSIDDGTTTTLLQNLKVALNAAGITAPQFDISKKNATTEFVKKSGFQFSQTYFYSAGPIALSASQAGGFIDLASAYSGSVTLPALSSVPDGATFYIWSGAASSVTVQRSGSDVIFVNGAAVTSLTLNNGDTLVIGKSGPASAWVAMWGSAQFPYSAVGAALAPKPTLTAGVGQFQIVIATMGTAWTLPAGGTWAYFTLPFNASGNVSTSSPAPQAGVSAGGASPGTATAGYFWYGFAWRLQ
ncbi:hypothetical protein [Burkholderia vietnamiensis]|uniref:hypothetical protein n=1 Tax=Burkholderia vietnamiensis TaxID=60552 RepID=UPI001593E64F|nr:hypothetical protein [Burkholderia vietnamiensis]